MAFYELVNLGSGNRVGDYDTEQDALDDVWTTMLRRGAESVATIALGFEGDDGRGWIVTEGADLAHRAALSHGSGFVTVTERRRELV